MEEKQINKFLRRRFSVLGWSLLGYNLLLNILVVAVLLVEVAAQFRSHIRAGGGSFQPDMNAAMGNGWGYVLAVILGLVILYAWKGGDWWKGTLRKKDKPMTLTAFFCLLALTAGAQLPNSLWIGFLEWAANLFGRSFLELLDAVSGDADTVSLFLYSAILAPISEEILFRGLVLRSLQPFGKRFAIFGSAFLFAIFHGNLLQTPYAFVAGLVLGYTALEYSVVWAAVIHMFNNLVLADLLTRGLAYMPTAAADLISLAVFGGFTLFGAMVLVTKRREIRVYREGEAIDQRCLKWFFLNPGVLILTIFMAINMLSLLAA